MAARVSSARQWEGCVERTVRLQQIATLSRTQRNTTHTAFTYSPQSGSDVGSSKRTQLATWPDRPLNTLRVANLQAFVREAQWPPASAGYTGGFSRRIGLTAQRETAWAVDRMVAARDPWVAPAETEFRFRREKQRSSRLNTAKEASQRKTLAGPREMAIDNRR